MVLETYIAAKYTFFPFLQQNMLQLISNPPVIIFDKQAENKYEQ